MAGGKVTRRDFVRKGTAIGLAGAVASSASGNAPARGTTSRAAQQILPAGMPYGVIGDLKISRLILGSNVPGAHSRDLIYVTAMGKAYVTTALTYPGHFGVMCNNELVDPDDPDFAVASCRAYERLLEAISEIKRTLNPDLDVDAAATMTWSAVHGLSVLAPSLEGVAQKTETRTAPVDQLIEQFTAMLMHGFAAR